MKGYGLFCIVSRTLLLIAGFAVMLARRNNFLNATYVFTGCYQECVMYVLTENTYIIERNVGIVTLIFQALNRTSLKQSSKVWTFSIQLCEIYVVL